MDSQLGVEELCWFGGTRWNIFGMDCSKNYKPEQTHIPEKKKKTKILSKRVQAFQNANIRFLFFNIKGMQLKFIYTKRLMSKYFCQRSIEVMH